MTFWLRATDYAMVSGARGVAELAPGQSVAYDGSARHDAVIAELQAGRDCPVELIESESDPSLPAPQPDEAERDLLEREKRTEHRRLAHEQRVAQGENPPPPVPTPTTSEEAPRVV